MARNKEKAVVYAKQYNAEHKEEKKAYMAKYRTEHKEELRVHSKEYDRIYRETHRAEMAARSSKRYFAHKDEWSATRKAYRDSHKVEKALNTARYCAEHKEQKTANAARYYRENKEHVCALVKANRLAHPEVKYASEKRRKAREIGAAISDLTEQQWQERVAEYNSICAYCLKPITGTGITQEHMTPLSRNGNHTLDNVVPACQHCNSTKLKKTLLEYVIATHGNFV